MANQDQQGKLKCFLSYRRQDTIVVGTVGRIYDRFITHFGEGHAFMDVDDIPPGADFRRVLADAVSQADVLLVVIGTQWAEIMRTRGGDARDFVRIEIDSALERGIPVIPLLIGGAEMPQEGDLPESLADLLFRNAVKVDPSRDFHTHVTRLIADLERHYVAVEERVSVSSHTTRKTPENLTISSTPPVQNSLGMKFVPVPGIKDALFSVWQTRVQDYAKFAAENPGIDSTWKNVEYDGHKQGPDHPVVNLSWPDATAFCEWLSRKEGKTYRLPTDHEWSLAVGIGDREDPNTSPQQKSGKLPGVYPWGSEFPPPTNTCNWGKEERFPFTAPVGSFALEHLGIKDLSGNVWEWSHDWYDNDHKYRVLRGGSWDFGYEIGLRSSRRGLGTPSRRVSNFGFRCVLEVGFVG